MVQSEDNTEVYQNLTESKKKTQKEKFTLYLLLSCLTACMSSFTFGFNIGSTNLPTPLIKEFYSKRYFKEAYHEPLHKYHMKMNSFNEFKNEYEKAKANSSESLQEFNKIHSSKFGELSSESYFNQTEKILIATKDKLIEGANKVNEGNTLLWTVTTSMFVVGGMIGAFGSKLVLDKLGRKKGIIFHYIFSFAGAVLSFIAPYVNSPECIIISRFLYGIQGGMMCGLVPVYLNEISPDTLRGVTGVLSQLFITIGILIAQLLGFRQILGTKECWHILLAVPVIPSLIGSVFLLLFFSETPKALLIKNKDEESARKELQRLRNREDVDDEIEAINQEAKDSNKSDEALSLKELFSSKELRWPLLTGLVLQLTQQLCGINAIFFYSEGIFRRATIQDEHIQYAVVATGVINVICTIVCVPLIEKLGRKPLLMFPMLVMILDFIMLTVFLVYQETNIIFSYLSIVCIVIFIMCFAVGLGPIPFIYVAECFKQDARGAALSICMLANWIANLILTLSFEYLAKLLNNYVFLVFVVIVTLAVIVIYKKVPETKGKTVDEIMVHFTGKNLKIDESTGKLMNPKV